MTTTGATGATADSERGALDEPSQPIARSWTAYWALAHLGLYTAMFAALTVVLPKQAELIAGAGGKEAALAWVTIVGAAVAIAVGILAGAYSDRTTSRFGRRQPWVLAGAVLGAAALALQGWQTTLLGMVLVWAVAQVGMNMAGTALAAAVPDDVPVHQRATVSAWWGAAQAVGPLLGIAATALVVTGLISGFALLAVVYAVMAVPFAAYTRGVALHKTERPALSILAGLRLSPRRHPDFAWALSGRFFIQLSNALAQLYLYFFLSDRVRYADPDLGVLILTVLYTVGVIVAALPAGIVSDRTGRRKNVVITASVLQGIAGLILAALPTFGFAMVAAAILGIGYGIYASVDQALISQVLPTAADRGKDLGVLNIANTAPYVLAPAIAAPVVTTLGGYPVLYLLVLVTAVIAAATVIPIRSVR